MSIRSLFPTLIYRASLGGRDSGRFTQRLLDEAEALRLHDVAGRDWSDTHYVGGYTSYATHAKLHRTSSTFGELERRLAPHARAFAARLRYDLRGRSVDMTDCWVNFMPAQVAHGLHLHPMSFLSGAYYVRTPRGSAGLKFEDPRLSRLMAAPPRRTDAPVSLRSFVTVPARAGMLTLFESWLRHEVPATRAAGERVSISFNYAWSQKG
ncbi:hypothetical protein FHP25_39530 [Vineibacter terrae]|uniref:2OG-Fe(II) oxygenase n=1 Tax=Vineibacter terrae TaxID=2586908 RepID=A0A5C8P6E8_9HYPH|nr:TIGR02466 family protein [Vineibacter terrae]TXL69329.1 hypothetical protein FHP25_39530 [Vineibacter terrae]